MRIAVTGMGVVSAAGCGVDETLGALCEGRSGVGGLTLFDSIHDVPVGEVRGVEAVDGVSRTAVLGMMAAREALMSAGERKGLRTGLVSATSTGGMDRSEVFFREFVRGAGRGRLRDIVGHECADSTRRIAAQCGITDFVTTISTACSSSANAIMLGARLLRAGRLDRVVAGGTDALCRFTLNGFRSLMILDNEPCRPFDDSRAGLNLGEGAAYLVLEREDIVSGRPLGWLSGWGNANDAFHQTASSAGGEGAFRAMSEALRCAGLGAGDIGWINAHGTGTPNNDASEGAAMSRLFGRGLPPFGSTKPFTGHTLAAAGAIEAVISLLALREGTIFPSLNFRDGVLRPHTVLTRAKLRHVLSNSFGFGGNNSTLIFSADGADMDK